MDNVAELQRPPFDKPISLLAGELAVVGRLEADGARPRFVAEHANLLDVGPDLYAVQATVADSLDRKSVV